MNSVRNIARVLCLSSSIVLFAANNARGQESLTAGAGVQGLEIQSVVAAEAPASMQVIPERAAELTAIPEPAAYVLFGVGLLVVANRFRRRR